MALTTYLSQTAFGAGVFYGVGLGVRGPSPLTLDWVTARLVVGLQALFARYWPRPFRFGPIEWVWRCFTFERLHPLRLALGGCVDMNASVYSPR